MIYERCLLFDFLLYYIFYFLLISQICFYDGLTMKEATLTGIITSIFFSFQDKKKKKQSKSNITLTSKNIRISILLCTDPFL